MTLDQQALIGLVFMAIAIPVAFLFAIIWTGDGS
jgi:hypothetical protein